MAKSQPKTRTILSRLSRWGLLVSALLVAIMWIDSCFADAFTRYAAKTWIINLGSVRGNLFFAVAENHFTPNGFDVYHRTQPRLSYNINARATILQWRVDRDRLDQMLPMWPSQYLLKTPRSEELLGVSQPLSGRQVNHHFKGYGFVIDKNIRYFAANAPHWFVLGVIMLPVTVVFGYPVWRSRRRKKNGLCRQCGYDLRGSSGICPECGDS